MTNKELENEVEKLIDKTSFTAVLQVMEDIAYGKAQHLAENWQEDAMSKAMERIANRVSSALVSVYKIEKTMYPVKKI